MKRVFGALVTLVLGLGIASVAAAEPDEKTKTAKETALEARKAFERRDYVSAADGFRVAYGLAKVPTLGLWWGRALAEQGKLLEASECWQEVERLAVTSGNVETQVKAQKEAAEERTHLLARIPRLTVQLKGSAKQSVELSLDGKPYPGAKVGVPLLVNPGQHRVDAKAGRSQALGEVTIREGETKLVQLELRPKPVPHPQAGASPAPGAVRVPATEASANGMGREADGRAPWAGAQRAAAWVSLAVGGAGLLVWGIAGGIALAKRGRLLDQCANEACSPAEADELESYRTLRTVSTAGFWAGALGAVAGGLLVVSAPAQRRQQSGEMRASVWIGPASARVMGTF